MIVHGSVNNGIKKVTLPFKAVNINLLRFTFIIKVPPAVPYTISFGVTTENIGNLHYDSFTCKYEYYFTIITEIGNYENTKIEYDIQLGNIDTFYVWATDCEVYYFMNISKNY